jgi:hypothetical protein
LIIAVICLALGMIDRSTHVRNVEPVKAPAIAPPSMPAPVVEKAEKTKRAVYPYSVIPGGAYDRTELMAAVNNDPVVAEHYAGFLISEARVVQLHEDLYVHVSYRIANKVYWTSKKLRIPAGEQIITDGKTSARTRCGNKVSVLSEAPTAPEEPITESFEIPITPEEIETGTNLEIAELPNLPEGTLASIPYALNPPIEVPYRLPYAHYRGPRPQVFVTTPHGSEVPEPSTLILVVSGIAAQFLIWRRRV